MGYLQRASGIPNFSKAVISFWFRVPAATLAAAAAQWTGLNVDDGIDAGGTQDSNLPGMIPLVTFGPNPTATSVGGLSLSSQIGPSFIGINCGPQVLGSTPNTPSTPHLVAHFAYANESQDFVFFGTTHHNPKYIDIGFDIGSVTFFSAGFTIPAVPPAITVAPDVWHHVLVSFDVGSGCFPGTFYWAFDDVNYAGDYLFPSGGPEPLAAGAGTGDPNDIVSSLLSSATAGALETSGNPFAIPCTSDNVDFVYKVEKARLQIFTGVTLDTSVTDNRRAFVTAAGGPASVALSRTLLGTEPEIEFKTNADWIAGNNSGSAGNFTRTGTIANFVTPVPDITP